MKRVCIVIFYVIILLIIPYSLFAVDIEITAVVEKNNLSVGESFIYQIQIQGSDSASDFPKENWGNSNFTDSFEVEFLGGQNNSSRQISIINGRRKEIINTAYIISWSLTPKKTGTLTIPAISVSIDGKIYTAKSIKIESKEAEENENLKLLVSLDKYTAYVGEPLIITFTWYIGMNINDFVYSIPFFKDKNFSFLDLEDSSADHSSIVRFPVDGISVTAVQGNGTLKGRSFTTITFSRLVTPKTPGNFVIPKSVISVRAVSSGSSRASDLFSSFFSSFQAEYQQFTVPSNDITLEVEALPLEGKPDNFDGYIGELNIETSASPLNVRVGDPITLSIRISGPKNIAEWDPPDLQKQSKFSSNFKIPSEISAGKIEGTSVVFTQTIRSLNDTVTEIPELEIPYFDTSKGIYRTARSQAIPITVARGSAVKVEGIENSTSEDLQQEIVKSENTGINFNYTDVEILNNQNFGLKTLIQFPTALLLIFPPLFFIILFIITLSRDRNFFSILKRSDNTLSKLKKELKNIEFKLEDPLEDHGKKVKQIFQNYMSNKISADSGSIGEKDVKKWLTAEKQKIEDFPLIFEVFSLLDEIQFSGSFIQGKEQPQKIKQLINKVVLAVEDFEGRIK